MDDAVVVQEVHAARHIQQHLTPTAQQQPPTMQGQSGMPLSKWRCLIALCLILYLALVEP